VALSFKGSFLCTVKKETIQIDIFHLRSNSSSRSFFLSFSLLLLFSLISSHLVIIKREERLHTFSFSLSLFILTILYSLSPSSSSSSLSYCGFFVHIYILYIRHTVTKVEPIYRTYLYNTVDMHTML